MTTFAIPAQFAHTTSSPVMTMAPSTGSQDRLERIYSGEPVAHVYEDDTRDWWDLVDNDKVFEEIAADDFQAFVLLTTLLA